MDGGLLLGLPCVLLGIVVSIGSLVMWVWMLIDCIQNEPSEGNDKIVWLLVIVLLNGLGALLYFFIRRPERIDTYGK